MKRHFIIASVCLLQSCTLTDERIAAHLWKCGTACGLSDVLSFDPLSKNTRLSGDTIYYSRRPVARIVQRTCRFAAGNTLHIVNMNTMDTCIYYEQ